MSGAAASSSASIGSGGAHERKDSRARTEDAYSGEPLSETELKELDLLLFGKQPKQEDVDRWHQQGFVFSQNPALSFGLTQLHGGPCGILAPVQAFLVHDLVWEQKIATQPDTQSPVKPSDAERMLALIRALYRVLRELASTRNEYIMVKGSFPNNLRKVVVRGAANLQRFIASHMSTFQSERGVLLFVYSALFTRGLARLREEMDDIGSPLVGLFGHCSQELLNLMLCGKAVTNVHDGDKVLGEAKDADAYVLHGIPKAGDVGFLTLLEASRDAKVGEYYKCPNTPIWVVGSASHYTVLFALDKAVGRMNAEAKAEQPMKMAFQALDPEGNGFVTPDKLTTLIAQLDLAVDSAELQRLADPEGMGVILWNNFKQAVTKVKARGDWACPTCTLKNKHQRTTCEVCDTAAPQPDTTSVVAPTPGPQEPTSFTLYHYNGIDKGKDVARCTPVTVMRLDAPSQGMSMREGLREVILTKWPGSLVEYPSGEPKII